MIGRAFPSWRDLAFGIGRSLRERRARICWLPTWMERGRMRFHFAPLVKHLRGARLIVVNAPANPTGGVFAAEDLEQIAWWAARRDVLIFSDEVFETYRRVLRMWSDADQDFLST